MKHWRSNAARVRAATPILKRIAGLERGHRNASGLMFMAVEALCDHYSDEENNLTFPDLIAIGHDVYSSARGCRARGLGSCGSCARWPTARGAVIRRPGRGAVLRDMRKRGNCDRRPPAGQLSAAGRGGLRLASATRRR